METLVLGVSDLLALVNQTLEYAYPSVVVEGELSSFKVSKGKYVFFDLKDDAGIVNCFMMIYQLHRPLEDGMRVRVVAQPKLTAWGKFSLTVREVFPVGEGSIKRSFELLRARLAAEGLFEPSRKRLLPAIPERVGLIASVESAGYADFIKIVNHRWGDLHIEVADVQVQGSAALDQIIAAIKYFNEQAEPVDVLVLVRGGGSVEDLAVWSEEPLVRAVAASRTPTLVGVGHEVDTSLADLAADVRAATPSNAAQLLVPEARHLRTELHQKQERMLAQLSIHRRQLSQQTARAIDRFLGSINQTLLAQKRHVDYACQTLRQLDPKVVLRRGYALVRDEQGQLLKDSPGIAVGSQLVIELNRSIINAGVTHVRTKE